MNNGQIEFDSNSIIQHQLTQLSFQKKQKKTSNQLKPLDENEFTRNWCKFT